MSLFRLIVVWRDSGDARTRLDAIAARLSGRPLHDALDAAAKSIQIDARRRVPVVSGRLQRSITAESSVSSAARGRSVVARVGSALPYAPLVEYGGRRRRAHPFLRPAFEAERADILARLKGLL
ncbi:MAG: HK97-gp10 family putative phage morphogenesis protein [Chloroflexota bacterium]|nr:HK97-gp10 family putative phage morphogenesis protein [Chloroflexota bacterium]